MKTNPILNEMQSLLIQIHSAESNKRAAEIYAKQHNLTGERLQDIEADIKNFTNLANNLKKDYNELLSTLKPF